jgi:hypothetical protein
MLCAPRIAWLVSGPVAGATWGLLRAAAPDESTENLGTGVESRSLWPGRAREGGPCGLRLLSLSLTTRLS